MAESYGFFDAEELVGGGYDREYLAEQFANYFKLFIGNGVFASPTNQLKVVAGTGLNIILKSGWAFINGYWYYNDDDLEIPVPANTTAQTVTSGVFIQFNAADRTIHTIIGTGRTQVDRDAPYYELKIADIALPTATTAITDAMITDTRTNENVCGFVKGLLEGVIPTNDLFAQYTSMFMDWFDRMKGQLSEDAAGNLQSEIDNIPVVQVVEELSDIESMTEFDGEAAGAKAVKGLYQAFSSALTALKNTAIAQAVGANGSTFTSVIAKLDEIVNRGKVTTSIGLGQSYTIPQGYHNGQGTVSNSVPDARNSSKVGTLTKADGRRVHSLREIWRVANSDGTTRTCFELPATGYYENTDIVAATDAQIKNLGWLIPSGTKSITANGNNQDVKNYASVNVNVPRGNLNVSVVISGQGDRTSFNCNVGDMLLVAGGAYSGISGATKVAGSGWTEWYRTTATTVTWYSYDGSITRIY